CARDPRVVIITVGWNFDLW
nr:immunoglobulin heavy chain junction region [Macaca mulatta]